MADRPDHDLADRPTEVLAELLHHRATQNAIVRSYGIMPSSRPEDDDLDRAAAARLRQLTDENERLTQWKPEATEVIDRWELVYEALGDVGGLGQFRSDAVLAEVLRMRSELDRLHQVVTDLDGEVVDHIGALLAARRERDELRRQLDTLRNAIAAHEDCCGTDFWPELQAAVGDPEEGR